MRRNVYVLVDETKNEIIAAQVARSDEDIKIQLDNALQKESFDVKVSCYCVNSINLDDDNIFTCQDLSISEVTLDKVWTSIKTDVSKNVKSDVMEEEE